ncbi:hypothetical protein F4827_003114 [Paraburkholderia bannensis]|uniref:Uncharacterized protein n=1 Tax=Paraburkholderia bannensis TaxID=765414 RepID=A0A7W9WT65_9BURK|nr:MULTISPECIES: hypothetical protein [Paraburkholderia]MBB3258246.1 hypothetical protein [Paraburkholderia sp. WP4_3_2]MBB6103259.1 hypothetical protein [Paraburkholderia bannensis]
MKKLLLAVGLVASMLFAGCATNGTTSAPKLIITPQQLATDFCPVVNADLAVIAASPLLNASQKVLLNGDPSDATKPGIIAINKSVCAAGNTIDVTNLETLNNTAFPALITLVGALPMLPNQPAILLGLTLAQPILNQVLATVQAQQAAAASPASTASAASAPVAASQ